MSLGGPFPCTLLFTRAIQLKTSTAHVTNLRALLLATFRKIVVTTHHRGSANRQDTRACQAIIRLAIPEHPWIVIQRNRRSLMRMTMMMSSECI
jgi:hypothetical protein